MSVCAAHGAPTIVTCERCGSFCCAGCFVVAERQCSACVARVRTRHEPLPWDERATQGRLVGFVKTWGLVMLRPGRTFAQLPPHAASRWGPFWFALICCLARWSVPLLADAFRICREVTFLLNEGTELRGIVSPMLLLIGAVLGVPLAMAFLRVFLFGGLDLLLLRLARCGGGGVEAHLRGACYASAPALLGAIPHAWWALELWQALLRITAYRHLHGNRGPVRAAAVTAIVLVTLVLYLAGGFVDTVLTSALHGMQVALGIAT